MTLATTENIQRFLGNGSSVLFSFTKKTFLNSTLVVTLRDTATTPDTITTSVLNGSGTYDYTAVVAGDFLSTAITFNTAPLSTHKITVERILPVTQTTDLTEAQDLPVDDIETIEDRLVMLVQQIQDAIGRSFKFSSDVSDAGILEITDELSDRASKFLQFNSLGALILNDLSALSASVGVDETDTDVTKDKLVSNNLMKLVNDYRLVGHLPLAGGTLTGNLNGRDITADGTKLDGIEALAKTPQGLALLLTATASASSSIDFTTNIDSTYEEYELHIINLVPATDDSEVRLVVSEDGGSTFKTGASDYELSISTIDSGNDIYISQTEPNLGHILLTRNSIGGDVGNAAGESFSGVIKIFNPSETSLTKLFQVCGSYIHAGGTLQQVSGSAAYKGTSNAIDALRIIMDSGNITSGKFKLYGVKK